jgi:hypothetical protein
VSRRRELCGGVTLPSELTGEGIVVVEGARSVPAGARLSHVSPWRGCAASTAVPGSLPTAITAPARCRPFHHRLPAAVLFSPHPERRLQAHLRCVAGGGAAVPHLYRPVASPLYNRDILRLAASIPHLGRLAARTRVPRVVAVCGSRIAVEVRLDAEGAWPRFAQEVRACALGRRARRSMGAHAVGAFAGTDARRGTISRHSSPGDRTIPARGPAWTCWQWRRVYSAATLRSCCVRGGGGGMSAECAHSATMES